MNRDLDVEVAEKVMNDPCSCSRCPDVKFCRRHGKGGTVGARFYSSDIAAAMQVENRIAELGLQGWYVMELAIVTRGGQWGLVHATARERCLAALAAITTQAESGPQPLNAESESSLQPSSDSSGPVLGSLATEGM